MCNKFSPGLPGLPKTLESVCVNIGMPVMRTDGRSVYGHVISTFSRMDSLPHFITHGAPLRALRARVLRYKCGFSPYIALKMQY